MSYQEQMVDKGLSVVNESIANYVSRVQYKAMDDSKKRIIKLLETIVDEITENWSEEDWDIEGNKADSNVYLLRMIRATISDNWQRNNLQTSDWLPSFIEGIEKEKK